MAEATVRQQLDALALQIERQSPFGETGHHFHLGTNFISLWLWDESVARAAAEATGVDLDGMRVVPETALLPRGGTGARLVATVNGVEGQSWSHGDLAASRWWPTVPDERSWVLFQRGAALPPDQITATIPTPLRLGWLDRPWTRMPSHGARALAETDMRLVAAVAAVLIVMVYGYLGAAWLRLTLDTRSARAESAEVLRQLRRSSRRARRHWPTRPPSTSCKSSIRCRGSLLSWRALRRCCRATRLSSPTGHLIAVSFR